MRDRAKAARAIARALVPLFHAPPNLPTRAPRVTKTPVLLFKASSPSLFFPPKGSEAGGTPDGGDVRRKGTPDVRGDARREEHQTG